MKKKFKMEKMQINSRLFGKLILIDLTKN